jgi:hypothetical protein
MNDYEWTYVSKKNLIINHPHPNPDDTIGPKLSWFFNKTASRYESNACWNYMILIEYDDGEFNLKLCRNAYTMVQLKCEPGYYDICLSSLMDIAESEQLKTISNVYRL